MMLREAIEQYILWRQAHGAKFTSEASVLRRFLGYADGHAACDAVTKAQVLAYLAGKGPLTRYRENKYYALAGFWRYAISRDHASRSPLPDNEPRYHQPGRDRTSTRPTNCDGSSILRPSRSAGTAPGNWTRSHSGLCLSCYMEPGCASVRRRALPRRISICKKPS
jgi:hypothetical protein